jgi:hypothetical protein
MRYLFIALSMLMGPLPLTSAHAQVTVDMGAPGIDIGVYVATYPELVLVPGYPVYYDPRGNSNYFYYDGLYWVYQGDNWYASSWYDGPWRSVGPENVPLFVLRVPVRYYRQPPVYFRGWRGDAAPRWGEHWGPAWQARRGGWERWDRRAAPRPAPLPVYQRNYSGERYPRAQAQQHSIRSENYRYHPREPVTQQQFQRPGNPGNPGRSRAEPPGRSRAEPQRQAPAQQRPSNPQHAQPTERRQQPQPARPEQQARPQRPMPQTQPAQPQRAPGESQDRGREKRNEERSQDHR